MTGSLAGKVALVTGAARGIGRAIAERYVAEGAHVAVADLNETGAREAAAAIGRGAMGVRLDVTRPAEIEAAMEATVAAWGRIDILVNNAGIFDLAPILDITRESYGRVFAVNVEGLLFTLQAARAADGRPGRGRQDRQLRQPGGPPGRGAGRGVLRVQGGGDKPDAVGRAGPDPPWHQCQRHRPRRGGCRALGRRGRPASPVTKACSPATRNARSPPPCRSAAWRARREIAGMAVFLASSDADYVVAQTYGVDGGNWMA